MKKSALGLAPRTTMLTLRLHKAQKHEVATYYLSKVVFKDPSNASELPDDLFLNIQTIIFRKHKLYTGNIK